MPAPLPGRVNARLARVPPAGWVLVLMMATYAWVFGRLTWAQQSNFGTFGFDMGIYDQGIWLLSRFQEPFLTVRGLHYFGSHVNPITILFVPFFWLGAGPRFLYLAETIVIAAGAIPLWLFARDRFFGSWAALVPAGAYLLYPTLEWINWWHFHPDALIITPLLFAWWLASRRHWRGYFLAAVVTLACKEDAALAVFMIGMILMTQGLWAGGVERRRRRAEHVTSDSLSDASRGESATAQSRQLIRVGTITLALAVSWWLLCTEVIIPWANGGLGPFYTEWFPGFGDSVPSVVRNVLADPAILWQVATEGERTTYYLKLLTPVAFLALASPAVLIGAPQLVVNVISAHGYTHDFKFHYSSIVLAAIFLATVDTIGRIGRNRRRALWLLLLVLGAFSSWSHVHWSPSPLGKHFHSGIWAQPSDRHRAARAAIELIPDDAGVTATYYLVPHLTHRRLIYEFPNPWVVANWGVRGENPGDPADIDYLVIDTSLTGVHGDLYASLTSPDGPYRLIFSRDGIEVAERRPVGAGG